MVRITSPTSPLSFGMKVSQPKKTYWITNFVDMHRVGAFDKIWNVANIQNSVENKANWTGVNNRFSMYTFVEGPATVIYVRIEHVFVDS